MCYLVEGLSMAKDEINGTFNIAFFEVMPAYSIKQSILSSIESTLVELCLPLSSPLYPTCILFYISISMVDCKTHTISHYGLSRALGLGTNVVQLNMVNNKKGQSHEEHPPSKKVGKRETNACNFLINDKSFPSSCYNGKFLNIAIVI